MENILSLIEKHYGINSGMVADENKDSTFRRKDLETIYKPLGESQNDETILDCLCVMTCFLEDSAILGRVAIERRTTDELIRREILKLYVFCGETRSRDTVTVYSSTSKVKFANYNGWLRERLLKPFFDRELTESITLAKARETLEYTRKKAGRVAPDPRMQFILLGTYDLVTALRSFPTPMPGKLCDFLGNLLIFWNIMPDRPVIDAAWIRAQLRYLKSKPVKPSLPK